MQYKSKMADEADLRRRLANLEESVELHEHMKRQVTHSPLRGRFCFLELIVTYCFQFGLFSCSGMPVLFVTSAFMVSEWRWWCFVVNTVVLSPSGFGRVWDVQTENGGLPALHWGPAHTESGFYEQRGKALRATHTHALAWQRAATALQDSLIMYWIHFNEFLNRTLTGL